MIESEHKRGEIRYKLPAKIKFNVVKLNDEYIDIIDEHIIVNNHKFFQDKTPSSLVKLAKITQKILNFNEITEKTKKNTPINLDNPTSSIINLKNTIEIEKKPLTIEIMY